LRESRRETVGIDVHAAGKSSRRELAVRFAFGFVVSVLVGLIALGGANRVAGLFLAFPAILPASLTLISREDGREAAIGDAFGASLGGFGLCAFGATSYAMLGHVPVVVAELTALAVWLGVAIGGYALVRVWLRRGG